jgi:hypothetical protein
VCSWWLAGRHGCSGVRPSTSSTTFVSFLAGAFTASFRPRFFTKRGEVLRAGLRLKRTSCLVSDEVCDRMGEAGLGPPPSLDRLLSLRRRTDEFEVFD